MPLQGVVGSPRGGWAESHGSSTFPRLLPLGCDDPCFPFSAGRCHIQHFPGGQELGGPVPAAGTPRHLHYPDQHLIQHEDRLGEKPFLEVSSSEPTSRWVQVQLHLCPFARHDRESHHPGAYWAGGCGTSCAGTGHAVPVPHQGPVSRHHASTSPAPPFYGGVCFAFGLLPRGSLGASL